MTTFFFFFGWLFGFFFSSSFGSVYSGFFFLLASVSLGIEKKKKTASADRYGPTNSMKNIEWWKLGDDAKRVWKIEWWVMSYDWWVMSDEWWVMEIEWLKKWSQTAPNIVENWDKFGLNFTVVIKLLAGLISSHPIHVCWTTSVSSLWYNPSIYSLQPHTINIVK